MRFGLGSFVGAFGVCVLMAGSAVWAQERRAEVPPATACNNENASCREDCTMDFGASIRTRAKLGKCLQKCTAKHRTCTERWAEIHRNNLDPANFETEPKKAPPVEDRTRFTEQDPSPAPPEDEPLQVPADVTPPESEPALQPAEGRTRVSEEKPAATTASTDEEEAQPRHEPEPAPSPAPAPSSEVKPVRKTHSDLPPEPEGPDISDWDPDGD